MQKIAPSATSLELVREEWDFRPPTRGLLPEDEVLACHTYETARLGDERWMDEVRTWRAQSKQQSFDALLLLRAKCLEEQQTPPHEFFAYWPEWPDQPYLKVREHIRRERRKVWTGRTFKQSPALPSVSFRHLFAYRDAFNSGAKPAWVDHSGYREASIDPQAGTIRLPLKIDPQAGTIRLPPESEIAAFKIRFSTSDDVLAGQFKQWLQTRRLQNGIPNPDTRGERGLAQRLRKELLTLGVWRLRSVARLTNYQAIAYTRRVSGRPLFANPSTWSENFGRAKKPGGIAWRHQKSSS
jgi:hypothetical protein